MLIVSYDIENTKLRTRFSTFLKKYGYRLQYSVYEIKNSERILKNIIIEIENNFSKSFGESDSVMIFRMSATCEKIAYGYQRHADTDFLFVD